MVAGRGECHGEPTQHDPFSGWRVDLGAHHGRIRHHRLPRNGDPQRREGTGGYDPRCSFTPHSAATGACRSAFGHRQITRHGRGVALPLQRERELTGGRKTVGGELLECMANCGVYRCGHAAPHHRQRAHLFGHEPRDDCLRRAADVRRLAGEHLVRHGPQRVDVGAGIDRAVTRGLLRAHVLRRTERETGLRHALAAGLAHGEGDAEVRHERLAVGEQDVLRLEIAVDDATAMRVVERLRDGDGESHGLLHGQLLLALEAGAQRLAIHEGHDVEEQAPGFPALEQRQEIRVLQVGRDANL